MRGETQKICNNFMRKVFAAQKMFYICTLLGQKRSKQFADVAQLVERNLAKVEVAGSNLVIRSNLFFCPDGGIGRHAGLKILWP